MWRPAILLPKPSMPTTPPCTDTASWALACDQAAGLELEAHCRRWWLAVQTLAWLERRLGRLPRGLWLDVACGTGILLDVLNARLSGEGFAYFGADASAAAIELARLRHPGAAGRFTRAAPSAIPTVGGLHDVWLGLDLLAWATPAERAATLAEAKRLLRPGGLLVLAQPHVVLGDTTLVGLQSPDLGDPLARAGFGVRAIAMLAEPPLPASTVDLARRRHDWPRWIETALQQVSASDPRLDSRLLVLAEAGEPLPHFPKR